MKSHNSSPFEHFATRTYWFPYLANLDQHVDELGRMIQEIVRRFQNAHGSVSRGPHTQVSHNELFLIEVIGDHGPQMMKDAASKLGIAVNTLTGIVDQLEGKGLISRSRSQTDRRVVFVLLTPVGKRVYKSACKAKHEFHRANLSSLTPLERGELLDLFKKMAIAGSGNAASLQPRHRKRT